MEKKEKKAPASEKEKTILFVEAHNELAHEVQNLFGKDEAKRNQYKFLFAESAQETNEILKKHKVDVVILDIILPVINGFHLIQSLQKKKQSVIVYTRLKHADDLGKIASMNVDNIVLKEFYKMEDLLHLIEDGYKKPMTEVLARIKRDMENSNENDSHSKFKMLQCPKCRLILLPESHFCNNCGERIIKEIPKALVEKPATKDAENLKAIAEEEKSQKAKINKNETPKDESKKSVKKKK